MFTTIRHYRCDPSAAREIAHAADEKFADRLAGLEGFVAYEVIDCGDGRLFSLTVFKDRASSERSNALAAEFVRDQLSHVDIEREMAVTGEVVVNRAREDALELVHA